MIRHRFTGAAMLIAPLCSLAGCGVLDFADDEYGCTGLPRGVSCRSARDVLLHSDGAGEDAPSEGADGRTAAGSSDPVPESPGVLKIYYAPFTDSSGDWHPATYLLVKTGGGAWLMPGGERK